MKIVTLASCALFYLMQGGISLATENFNVTYVEPEYLENLYETGQYEEFSKLFQIDDVNLVRPTTGERSENPMFIEGLTGGDILLRPWQREEARQGLRSSKFSTYFWRKYVPYVIKGFKSSQVAAIKKAISKWNSQFSSIIRYRPRLFDKDYVMFFNGNGCYSNLGKVGGQQPISLKADGCLTEGTIHHEMTHAIGITHEHERPDRDEYIKILPENIPAKWQSQYEKSSYEDFKILGKYDYYSVMHYPISAPGTHKPAFQVLKPNVDLSRIGQRVAQTETDKEKIRKLYS